MPTARKEAAVEELTERLASAKSLIFTDYAGLTVGEITKLRSELRKDGNTYSVVKNTLFRIAAGDLAAQFESILPVRPESFSAEPIRWRRPRRSKRSAIRSSALQSKQRISTARSWTLSKSKRLPSSHPRPSFSPDSWARLQTRYAGS